MERQRTLHLVEPDQAMADLLTKLLAEEDVRVRTYPDAERFLEDGPGGSLDDSCLLIEADLPGASGVSLVEKLRARKSRAPMILLTGAVDRGLRRRALAAGATDVLERTLFDAFLVQRLAQIWPSASSRTHARSARVELADGTLVTYREMCPEDAEIEAAFVRGLSEEARHMRFFSSLRELPPSVLEEFTNPQYPYSYALIATVDEPDESGQERERQIGVARYMPTEDPETAEFAVVVADDWQRRGIATRLMRLLTTAAAVAGVRTLEGLVLRENHGMLDLCRALGFLPSGSSGDYSVVRVAKALHGDDAPEA